MEQDLFSNVEEYRRGKGNRRGRRVVVKVEKRPTGAKILTPNQIATGRLAKILKNEKIIELKNWKRT